MGQKRVISLLKFETDAELFESLLSTLLRAFDPSISASSPNPSEIEISSSSKPLKAAKWFEGLTETENFCLMMRFLASETKLAIRSALEANDVAKDVVEKYN